MLTGRHCAGRRSHSQNSNTLLILIQVHFRLTTSFLSEKCRSALAGSKKKKKNLNSANLTNTSDRFFDMLHFNFSIERTQAMSVHQTERMLLDCDKENCCDDAARDRRLLDVVRPRALAIAKTKQHLHNKCFKMHKYAIHLQKRVSALAAAEAERERSCARAHDNARLCEPQLVNRTDAEVSVTAAAVSESSNAPQPSRPAVFEEKSPEALGSLSINEQLVYWACFERSFTVRGERCRLELQRLEKHVVSLQQRLRELEERKRSSYSRTECDSLDQFFRTGCAIASEIVAVALIENE